MSNLNYPMVQKSSSLTKVIVLLCSAALPAACNGVKSTQPATTPFSSPPASSTEYSVVPKTQGDLVVAGAENARFAFFTPAPLRPLRGVHKPTDPAQAISFDTGSPAGVGMYSDDKPAYDSVVVFSDPKGLGMNFVDAPSAEKTKIAMSYAKIMKQRFPSVDNVDIVELQSGTALRMELPLVQMPQRPTRAGRHYLLFNGDATVSVDCLWTPENKNVMSASCDQIASSLKRVH